MKKVFVKTELDGWNGQPYIINTPVTVTKTSKGNMVAEFKYQCTSFACQGQWSNRSFSFVNDEYSEELLIEKVRGFIKAENK